MATIGRRSLGLLALAAAASLASHPAAAQAPPAACPYDRCFLRLDHEDHAHRVVQGLAATPIATLGLFAPRIDLLATGSDSARVHYEAFRANYNRAGVSKLVFLTTALTGLVVVASNPRANHGLALGLFAGTLPFDIAGLVSASHAKTQLEQAIGFYNRSLEGTP